jgi:hypothetical protein
MIIDNTIDRKISKILIAENEAEKKNHQTSGKLSASMLNWPLQHIMLKLYGISPDPLDEYVIRKFKRGKEIEKWLIESMDDVIDKQRYTEYKNTVGFIDAIVDSKDYECKVGIIPHEVKSVSNAKFRRITQSGVSDISHSLQASFYAISEGLDYFAIDYVSADDLRIHCMIDRTENWRKLVDKRISEVEKQLKLGFIPVFKAREEWQNLVKYNSYSTWFNLTDEEIVNKIIKEYL